jgi:hypothetical protein
MSISVATSSHRFVCGVRLSRGLRAYRVRVLLPADTSLWRRTALTWAGQARSSIVTSQRSTATTSEPGMSPTA